MIAPPFLIALFGYSGSGRSYLIFGVDGLFSALISQLPPVWVTRYEALREAKEFGIYGIPEDGIDTDLAVIIGAMSEARQTAATPANEQSSRSNVTRVLNINSSCQP